MLTAPWFGYLECQLLMQHCIIRFMKFQLQQVVIWMLSGLHALLNEEDVLKLMGFLYEIVHHRLIVLASVSLFNFATNFSIYYFPGFNSSVSIH